MEEGGIVWTGHRDGGEQMQLDERVIVWTSQIRERAATSDGRGGAMQQ